MNTPFAPSAGNPALRSPYLVPGLFSPEECGRIIASVGDAPLVRDPYSSQHPETVIGENGERRLLQKPEVAEWVLHRIMQAGFQVNQQHFRFVIEGMEVPHLITYRTGQESYWHMDITDDQTTNRKLTMLVFLSAPQSYTGGRFMVHPESLQIDQSQGNLLLFPAFLLHRVEPVLSGTRYSLATWGVGPAFR